MPSKQYQFIESLMKKSQKQKKIISLFRIGGSIKKQKNTLLSKMECLVLLKQTAHIKERGIRCMRYQREVGIYDDYKKFAQRSKNKLQIKSKLN